MMCRLVPFAANYAARSHRRSGRKRTAAVTVEMALSASILFLFVFAAIEFSRMNMIRHTVDNAAYEAARRGLIMGATPADVRERADQLLDTLGIRGAEVEVEPGSITRETDAVTVTVTAPAAGNGFIAPHFFRGKRFTSECTLTRDAL